MEIYKNEEINFSSNDNKNVKNVNSAETEWENFVDMLRNSFYNSR